LRRVPGLIEELYCLSLRRWHGVPFGSSLADGG
jgi:hypothetical protein